MPPTKKEIIDGYNRLAETMETLLGSLSEQDLAKTVYPGWTAKDVICHLAEGSRAGLFFMSLAQTGHPGPGPDFDLDEWNAARVAERREKPLGDLLAEFRAGNDTSIKAVESAPDELLAKQVPNIDEGSTWLLADSLYETSRHGISHLNDIEMALRG